jgi:cell division protein FtsW
MSAILSRLTAPHLFAVTAALAIAGPVFVYSASAVRSEMLFGSSTVYLWRQIQGLLLGTLAAVVLARVQTIWLRRTGIGVFVASVLLLAATLTPLGVEQHGARRWLGLGIGGFGFSLQPLEFVKLGVVLGLAQWLAAIDDRVRDARLGVVIPLAAIAVPAAILLLQPDFGGAVLVGIFAMTLLFVGGARPSHLGAATLLTSPILILLAVVAPYRFGRIQAFIDPFSDPSGRGYQLIQSLLAFGAGGVFGTGLGAGQQKLGYLPEAHTDFILSVIGEEVGLVGVVVLLIALGFFGIATLAIAARARDRYGMLLATGAGLIVWMQAMINAAVAMGLLPPTGTTLPLLSYGRSSLITSLAAVGLVLNVARPGKRGRAGWR